MKTAGNKRKFKSSATMSVETGSNAFHIKENFNINQECYFILHHEFHLQAVPNEHPRCVCVCVFNGNKERRTSQKKCSRERNLLIYKYN
jgi:hypothetical protein